MHPIQIMLWVLAIIAVVLFLFLTNEGNYVLNLIIRGLNIIINLLLFVFVKVAEFFIWAYYSIKGAITGKRVGNWFKKEFKKVTKARESHPLPQLVKYVDPFGGWDVTKMKEDGRMHWLFYYTTGNFPNLAACEQFFVEAGFEDGHEPTQKEIDEKKEMAKRCWERQNEKK